MLQMTSSLATEPEIEQKKTPRQLFDWVIGVVRRQLLLILSTVVLGTLLGAIYVLVVPPTYTAEATIVIDPRRVQLFAKAPFSEYPLDGPAFETEIELVKSEPVALSVIKSLDLTKDPDFLEPSGVLGVIFNLVSRFVPAKSLSDSQSTNIALAMILKNLSVKRVGFSYNLSIQYRSANPILAGKIANEIAKAYIAEQLEGKYGSTKRATEWLQGRIEELSQRKSSADRAVIDYKQNNNLITADGKLLQEQRITELNTQIANARRQTSEAKAHLDRIDEVIRDDTFASKTNATVAATLNNPIITQLRTRYLDLVNREANWSRKYGANHLAVVNLRSQIRDLQESMLEEVKRLRESYLSEYEIAKQQEKDLEKRLAESMSQLQASKQAQVPLRDLESSAQNSQTIYDNFLQRYTESLQQQAFPISDARILAKASGPMSKSPKTLLILVIATGGGLALGVGLGVLRELMNSSLYTTDQVEGALQAPCISLIPLMKSDDKEVILSKKPKPMLSFNQGLTAGSNSQRTISQDCNVLWAALNLPFSRFAEAIRSIKLAIDLNIGAVTFNRVIGFTSSLPHEGKSTVAASLALMMAHVGLRVILVDCDLRNPSLSRRLAPNADRGILDVIAGEISLEDAVWTDECTNLTFLPAVMKTRLMYSSEILASDSTRRLFENLQSRYDYVLVDLSPLMPVIDTRATTGFVGSYVCIVEWGRTNADALKHAFKDAHTVRENLLGIVLNKVDINRFSRYYPTAVSQYQNKYYANYGVTD
jgi:succinoglycan biosynthesis transport protein ExoP